MMNKLVLTTACMLGLALGQVAYAVPFPLDLTTASATKIGGNINDSPYYNVKGNGTETGTEASQFSSQINGTAATGFTVLISFDSYKPVLTGAYLKASNEYLWWDAADLAPFNNDPKYDSIVLHNDTTPNGIYNTTPKGKVQFQDTSHAGVFGYAKDLPDGGMTAALLGLGMVGLHFISRRKV